MKALRVHDFASPDGPVLEDLPQPAPRAGEVRVQVHACGISFVDLLRARGQYHVKPPTPFVAGSEFAGVVDALGEGVTALKVGDAVCGVSSSAWAEYLCVAAGTLFRVDADSDLNEAAVVLASYGTALYALRERGGLREGETLLVLGAAGAVGLAAIQVGKTLGARVIAVATGEAKCAVARETGADEVLDTTSDWKEPVKQLTGGRGVDVVFDPIGGAATDTAFRCLGWCGRHLMVGFAGGEIGQLKTNLAIVKGASLVGVDMRRLSEVDPRGAARVFADVVKAYRAGTWRPRLHKVWPVAQFGEAARSVGERSTIGRVLIRF